MTVEITSIHNPRVKRLLSLQQKSRTRKELGLFVVEGIREVERALRSGYEAEELWLLNKDALPDEIVSSKAIQLNCNETVFKKVAYREEKAGVLAVFKTKDHSLERFTPPKNPLYVVVEEVEKPGNLGAILRTCNGLGASALFVCDSKADIYNPNVIRNSLGGFFNTPVIEAPSIQVIDFLNQTKVQIAAAYLPASIPYTDVNYKLPTALVFGSEANGLSKDWVENTNINCVIPMKGVVDSLNVSVAVAIILAEAVRQRI